MAGDILERNNLYYEYKNTAIIYTYILSTNCADTSYYKIIQLPSKKYRIQSNDCSVLLLILCNIMLLTT